MNTLIFDGETTQPVNGETIRWTMPLEEVLSNYQTGMVFCHTAKEFFAEQVYWSLSSRTELAEVETGLDLLYQRLVQELGEETADLIVARTSAEIILATCE